MFSAACGPARRIHERFFDEMRGLYRNSTEDANASVLVNALAILCGAAQGETARQIARQLANPP